MALGKLYNLTDTKGNKGKLELQRLSGNDIAKKLRVKYDLYISNSLLEDIPEDWEPIIREYRIPTNLSRELLDKLGFKPKEIANILTFIPLIYCIEQFKILDCRNKNFTGAQINSRVMKDYLLTLSDEYPEFVKRMVKCEMVEVSRSYKVGERSKQYKIGKLLKNAEWIEADFKQTLEEFLPEILVKSNLSRRKEVLYGMWDKASCYFLDWRDMPEGDMKEICRKTSEIGLNLIINDDKGDIEETIIKAAKNHIADQMRRGEKPSSLKETIQDYKKALSKFNGKDFYVTLHDERYKYPTFRLFTNFVNLKRELRPYLELFGRRLVNIDIKSCQVSLLATFYKPEDWEEKQKFTTLISEQDIYIFLAGFPENRSDAKIDMFRVMFDRTANQNGAIYEKFCLEFPILAQRIAEAKVGRYKNVAYLMQKKEAEIMIFGVLQELLIKRGIICLSIHDSISCFPEDEFIVRETIQAHFCEHMKFFPGTKKD